MMPTKHHRRIHAAKLITHHSLYDVTLIHQHPPAGSPRPLLLRANGNTPLKASSWTVSNGKKFTTLQSDTMIGNVHPLRMRNPHLKDPGHRPAMGEAFLCPKLTQRLEPQGKRLKKSASKTLFFLNFAINS